LALSIKEINTKAELKKFINFPFVLYKNTKQWVPPLFFDELATLSKDKNPAFEFCEAKYWLVYDENKIVGRIAGIINHKFIELWGKKAVRFGWIDFIDDENVFKMLMEAVIKWGKENNLEYIHGPLGFTDFDYEGMLVDGFNEISTMTTIYNFPYYPRLMEMNGFEKEVDWLEFEITVPDKIPDKAVRIANIVKEKLGIKLFEAKKAKDFLPYGREIFLLINEAYKNLFGFVPLSDKQIEKYIKQYLGFVVPDLLKLLLDSNNKVAGFVIGMPSLTKALQKSKGKLFPFGFIHLLRAVKKNKYADLFLGAIRPDLQGKGADAFLITELTKSCIERGIITAESNIELETNHLVQSHWKLFNTRQHKRRRCFIKKI
jgi:ribosomal protein S18 acetylase RimI-like enzyme